MSSEPVPETRETALSLISPASLEVVEARLNEFRAFVKRVLKSGVDYGTIPGTKKDTLLKPGAERILQLYGLTPIVVMDAAVEDFSASPPLFNYRVKIQLLHRGSGEVVGEGVGSCNSMEKKYRYRTEWWKDKKSQPPEGEGWVRKNGNWGAGYCRQMVSEDTADQANTILKMAKKRALIDAALTVGAASEFFTQDLDDFPPEERRAKSIPSKEAVIEESAHVEDADELLFEDLSQSVIFVGLKKALLDGFKDLKHRDNWFKKHKAEIDGMPETAKDKLRTLYLRAEVKGGPRSTAARPVGADATGEHPDPNPPAPQDGHRQETDQAAGGGEKGTKLPVGGAKDTPGPAARDQVLQLVGSKTGGEGQT